MRSHSFISDYQDNKLSYGYDRNSNVRYIEDWKELARENVDGEPLEDLKTTISSVSGQGSSTQKEK